MKRIIRIGKPYIEKAGDGLARLCADIAMPDRTGRLWFSVEERYDYALAGDRSDPFVAALVRTGMRQEADIVCEGSVSRRLLYRINHTYVPALAFAFRDLKEIRIEAEAAGPCETKGAVGCGCTFGVNSLYTALQNSRGEYPVTHFCLFRVGGFEGEGGRERFLRYFELVRAYAEQKGIDSLSADTNLHEFLDGRSPGASAEVILPAVLALQGLFGTYHYAAVFRDGQFRFSEQNRAFYDPLTVHCFSTDSLRVFLSGAGVSRIGKLEALADCSEEAARIHPCEKTQVWEQNCGGCVKCMRDMMVIHAARKTDRFAKVFDFEGFEEKMRDRPALDPAEGEDVLTAEALEFWKSRWLHVPG